MKTRKKTSLQIIANEHDFKEGNEYLQYIINSLINGQKKQVRYLFSQLSKQDQIYFLNVYLSDNDKYQKEVNQICTEYLVNKKSPSLF